MAAPHPSALMPSEPQRRTARGPQTWSSGTSHVLNFSADNNAASHPESSTWSSYNDDCAIPSFDDDFGTGEVFLFNIAQDSGDFTPKDIHQCTSLSLLDQIGNAFDIFLPSHAAPNDAPIQNYVEKHDLYQDDAESQWSCTSPDVQIPVIVHPDQHRAEEDNKPFYGSTHDDFYVSLRHLDLENFDASPCSDTLMLDERSSNSHTEFSGTSVDLENSLQSTHSGSPGRGPTISNGLSQRQLPSACANWLQRHGLAAYPNKKQLKHLAVAECKSVEGVRIALNNRRSREKKRLHRLAANAKEAQSIEEHQSVDDVVYSPPTGDRQDAYYTEYMDCMRPKSTANQIGDSHMWTVSPYLSPLSPLPDESDSYHQESYRTSDQCSGGRGRKGKRCYEPGYTVSTVAEALDASQMPTSDSLPPQPTYLYVCTFCLKRFKNEFSWRRHEMGVHDYNDVEWSCPFHDASLIGKACTLCTDIVHDMSHYVDKHNVHLCFGPWTAEEYSSAVRLGTGRRRHICSSQSVTDSTFLRKDLLAQHVQGIHLHTVEESVRKKFKVPSAWSKAVESSRIKPDAVWCGFCQCYLDSISSRMAHVAGHFRDGRGMHEWVRTGAGQHRSLSLFSN